MALSSVAELSEALRRLRLAQDVRIDELDSSLHIADAHPAPLAEAMVRCGWLTPLQAEYLLQGRGHELVLGPYLLLDRLGVGGMGEVFRARQTRLGRVVALKTIRPDHLSHPGSVERFRREALAAAKLQHPNVVTIFDADQADGTHFLAMEYVEGADLSKLVKTSGPLPVREACAYARQAALGLQHAHEQQLVHRDIKPSNLIITAQGAPGDGIRLLKILDFGLARFASEIPDNDALTPTDHWIGTPDFVSPEQARSSKDVDIRSDIFSLGCALYYLLTGKAAYSGSNRVEKLVARIEGDATPVSAYRSQVPPRLEAVLRRMLARNPAERYQTPAEVAQALEPFCRDDATAEKPTPTNDAAEGDQTVSEAKGSSARTLGALSRNGDSAPTPPLSTPAASTATSVMAGPAGSLRRPVLLVGIALTGLVVLLFSWFKFHDQSPRASADSFVNSIGMKLVRIPIGSFLMGAPKDEAEQGEDETPQHNVVINKSFFLGAYEVTQAEFQQVMGVNPSQFSVLGAGAAQIEDIVDKDKLPVEMVTWDEAEEFCRRLSAREAKDKRTYRLPTEAEWEYACRAGTTTPFHYGGMLSAAEANMNGRSPYGGAPVGKARQHTLPVGSFQPNAFGLYDMHGNVWEWCQDRWAGYAEKLQPGGPQQAFGRITRGGAWNFQGADCRSAKRTFRDQDSRSPHVGFRVVCEP